MKNNSKKASKVLSESMINIESTDEGEESGEDLVPSIDDKVPSPDSASDKFSALHLISGGRHQHRLGLLKQKGIVPKYGKWTSKECVQLHENMMEFLRSHNVKDFKGLIIPQCKEDHQFRKKTSFVLNMCRGIQRTRGCIEHKIVMQYSNFLTKGKFSDNEVQDLLQLHKVHGNSWKKIGLAMNRCHYSMNSTHELISKQWTKGNWSADEDHLLTKAISLYTSKSESISWVGVSRHVGTRNRDQCNRRWAILSSRTKQTEPQVQFGESDEFSLVKSIFESDVDDKSRLDWETLASQYDKSVTPSWLKWKFSALCKQVPREQYLQFTDVIERLYGIYQEKSKGNDVEIVNDDDEGSCIILID